MARIDPRLGVFARTMRSAPTPFEAKLWRALSGSKLDGHKFRRQAVLGEVIVDFFCPAIGLIIEVDGATHDNERDKQRDARLLQGGFKVLRFTNEQISNQLDAVLRQIAHEAAARPLRWPERAALTDVPTPTPSPEGEGG